MEAGYRGPAIRKDAVKNGGNSSTTGAISPRKAKNANPKALKGGLRGAKDVWRREYHFRSDP